MSPQAANARTAHAVSAERALRLRRAMHEFIVETTTMKFGVAVLAEVRETTIVAKPRLLQNRVKKTTVGLLSLVVLVANIH